MKKMMILALIFILLPVNLPAKEKRDQEDQQLFLAYNIWETRSFTNQKCINYKTGRLIKAGTEVINASVYDEIDESDMFAQAELKIVFKIKETGKEIAVGFTEKWHPGKTIYDYYDLMFTTKNFSELVAGLNESEIKSIRAGSLTPGMNKEAVLIAYGYPPEHRTPSLENNDLWIYWRNKFGTKKICFDRQSRTIRCTPTNTL